MRTIIWKSLKFSRPVIPLIFLTTLVGCSDDDSGFVHGDRPAPSVPVISVKLHPVGEYREFSGRTEAGEMVQLRARVDGYLKQTDFSEGSAVEQGQLLFSLDAEPFQAVYHQAEASLGSARAKLAQATADYKRGQELFSKGGFISQSDLDNLQTRETQARAGVEVSKANLKTAEINLSYTQIRAPFSGLISKQTYSAGSLVGPSSKPLAELYKTDPMHVNFQINAKTLLNYQQAQQATPANNSEKTRFTARLKLPNDTPYSEPGRFDFTDVKVDQTTGNVDMRATFPNSQQQLLPGMYVTLIIESAKKTDRPLIPQFAVQENMQGRFVLVVTKENRVESRIIELGRRIGPMWVVKSGLNAGERIVVSGLQKIRPDVVVNPELMAVDVESGALLSVDSSGDSVSQEAGNRAGDGQGEH